MVEPNHGAVCDHRPEEGNRKRRVSRTFFQRQCDAVYKRNWPAIYRFSQAIHERVDDLNRAEGRENVYIIRDTASGAVKIGVANDPHARLRGLQGGNPHDLELVDWTPGGQVLERFIHRHLDRHRLRGEWFAPVDEVLAVCELLMAGGDMRRTMLEGEDFADVDDTLAMLEGPAEWVEEWMASHPFQLSLELVA